jgi:hypothetical protein
MVIGGLGVERQARDERDRIRESLERELPRHSVTLMGPSWQARQSRVDVGVRKLHRVPSMI